MYPATRKSQLNLGSHLVSANLLLASTISTAVALHNFRPDLHENLTRHVSYLGTRKSLLNFGSHLEAKDPSQLLLEKKEKKKSVATVQIRNNEVSELYSPVTDGA